jgi:hypothetical protein
MLLPSLIRGFRATVGLTLALFALSCGSSSGGVTPEATTTFVGTLEGTNALVGLVQTGGQALLFFCGTGQTLTTLTHWMRGPGTVGGTFDLTDGSAKATVAAASGSGATHVSGTFTDGGSGKPVAWSADLVQKGTLAGVYTDSISEGLVALIVLQPDADAKPTAQGAFHEATTKNEILQVTPFAPIARTAKGLPVQVVVSGATEKLFLSPAVGN